MIKSSPSPHESILWILSNHGGKMERSRLRRCLGTRYADLDPILGEMARDGKIRIAGEMIIILWNSILYATPLKSI